MFLKFYSNFNSIGDIELLKNTKILCDINAIVDTYLIAIPSDIIRKKFLGNIKFTRHLNRTFKELESIIRCDNKKIYILDEQRLRDLSKGIFIKSF